MNGMLAELIAITCRTGLKATKVRPVTLHCKIHITDSLHHFLLLFTALLGFTMRSGALSKKMLLLITTVANSSRDRGGLGPDGALHGAGHLQVPQGRTGGPLLPAGTTPSLLWVVVWKTHRRLSRNEIRRGSCETDGLLPLSCRRSLH